MANVGSLTYEFKATTTGLQAGMRTAQEEMSRLNNHVRKSVEEFQRMGQRSQQAVALTRHELVNLSRQIQDVGVTIAMGQSPFTILIQQGTQIADIFASSSGGATAAIRGFAAQIGSIVTPARVAGAAGIAAFAGVTAAALSAVNAAASLTEAVKVLGTSFEGLRGLNQRGEVFGLDAKTMNTEMTGLAMRLSEAARNGGELAKFMQANGIAIKDANGAARPFKEVFADIARLVAGSGNELDKLNALKLLGLSEEFKRVFEEGGAEVQKFATGTAGTLDAWGEETRRRFEDLKGSLLRIWSDIGAGVVNYLSEIKYWALQIADAIQSAFRDVLRGIEAAIAGGKRLLGQASEAVGLGGKVGTSDFEYRQEALQIGRKRILDMRASEQGAGATALPEISVAGRGISFPEKAAKAHQDAIKNYIESLRVAEETAKAEVDNWKLGNIEREKAVALAKAEDVARREGRALTESERTQIEERAASTGRYKDKLEELREAQQRLNQVTREFQYAVSNALEDIILRGGRAKDVLAALTKELASAGLRQGLSGLFGDNSGKSQGGGIFGLLSGLFGGSGKGLFSGSPFKFNLPFFADGGTLGAGKWGIAGEAGPELIHGPASVSPFSKMGAQNISFPIHNYAAGVDVAQQMTPQGIAIIVRSLIEANNRQLPGILANFQARSNL